jgi:hypothetical protein
VKHRSGQAGMSLVLAASVVFVAAALLFVQVGGAAFANRRDGITERALAQARQALIAYASDRPIGAIVGPGFLPCPDADNDGWAESTCGSLAGDRGQEQRLGRLPWKTLGLPDLRDGHGERLWYAVSTRYKGLLNCAASAACVDHSPATALGTITVRDSSGRVTHDGTSADPEAGGAVAVVIAPGPPLARIFADGERTQRRDCAAGDCDALGRCLAEPPRRAAPCDPLNYLDLAPPERSGEDNADFHDRNDALRWRNGNGFIHGPIADARRGTLVNDRLEVIAYGDVMPRVMKRVALELAHCLAFYASRPENGGRLPPAAPACAGASGGVAPPFGRVPDTPFALGPGRLPRWWRETPRVPEALAELPTQSHACRIAFPPEDAGASRTIPPGNPGDEGRTAGIAEIAWWTSWKPFVLYAPAAGHSAPAGQPGCSGAKSCIELIDGEGRSIAAGRRAAIVVGARAGECESARLLCDGAACTQVAIGTARGHRHDAVVALP